MPNYIQYSTSSLTGSLRKGTVALGVTTSSIVGPTSITKWYSGITPNSGKYVIYKTADAGDPDIFCPQTDQELYNFVIMQGGSSSNITSVSASLSWISTQTNLLTANFDYENIVTDRLVFTTDAGFVGSYPTTGTIWYDLGGNGYNGTLTNGPTFNSSNSGSIVFDGTDDYVITQNTNYDFSTNANFTYCAWIYPGFSSTSNTGRAVIDFTSPAPSFLRSYLRWEGFSSTLGFYFDIASGGGSAWYTGVIPTFSANTWHHLCFVHNSSNAGTFYFDGAAVSTVRGVANAVTVTNNKITIGYGAVNSYYWAGRISNVQIYNKALTASEISQNYNAQKGRYVYLLLDLYPSAAAAYSVRKLRSAYTGSAIRVRRSSDNTEQDIGFSDGNLDTSALTTFVGANDGFVTTFYDQSGNARNATQATAANQPQIVVSGSVLTQGSKPIMKFTSSSQRLNTPSFSLSANRTYVMTLYNVTNALASYKVYLGAVANGADNLINGFIGTFASSNIIRSWVGSGASNNAVGVNATANNAYFLLGAYVQGSSQHQHYRNGALNAQNTSLTISPTTNSQVNSIMFNGANGSDLRTNEAIIWDSYQSTNRSGIESNINAYYAIY